MIDLHSHLLPALDDGARDLDESLAIARSMAEDGVRVVAATPHVRHDYPTTPERMQAALAAVRDAVARAGIPLDVRGGGEIALPMLERLDAHDLEAFGLGGNPRLVLLEYPYYGRPLSLPHDCELLRRQGVVPVIAHPERNAPVQEQPDDLRAVVDAGGIVQLTAASVDGRLGRRTAATARRLLQLGLAHLVSSDAHAPGVREAGLSGAVRALDDRRLATWLTEAVPAALIAGEPLPARPARARRGGLARLLRG